MFHIVSGLIALFVIWRLVWRQHWSVAAKWLCAVVIMLVAQHHLVTRSFFGTMASPEIPGVLLILFNWAFGGLILTAIFLLVWDLLGGIVWAASRKTGRALLRASNVRLVLGGGALLLAAVAVWQAVRVPDVRALEIRLANLPEELDGLRIVQLTDLHASRLLERPWMQEVVARTNALKPDLIVITGDLVDGTVSARADDVAPLSGLSAPLGVYAIPGNHEYYAEYQPWIAHFSGLGIQMLLNQHTQIESHGARFVLAGITDRVAEPHGQPMPDIEAALAGVGKEETVVLLSHRPPGAKENARAGADLQLSGHTHGGQVLGMHWVTRMANEGYVSGLYPVDEMQLYVSNGAGLWPGFAMRLGVNSEITLITLRAAAKAN